MKLQNKKTGEIRVAEAREDGIYLYNEITGQWYKYELDLLASGWEYYEEPKDDYIRVIESFINYVEEADESFACDETVQKFVKELKAWKRLKQGGFHWNGWTLAGAHFGVDLYDGYNNDLDILFGGEE